MALGVLLFWIAIFYTMRMWTRNSFGYYWVLEMKFVSPLVRNIRRFSIMINVRLHTIPYHQNNRVMLLCRVFRPTAFHKIFLPQSHWPKTNCFRHINTVHIAICVSPERTPGIGCYMARSHIIIEIANTHGFAGKHVQPQTRSTNLFLNNKRCTQISGSHLPIAYGAFVPNAHLHTHIWVISLANGRQRIQYWGDDCN